MKSHLVLLVACSAFWCQIKSVPKGFTEINCTLKSINRASKQREDLKKSKKDSLKRHIYPHLALKEGMSMNWSGYVATNAHPDSLQGSVEGVYGSWVVPKLSKASRNTYSAVWIGIDGYKSESIEQIGTAHEWVNGHQVHYAWFALYPSSSYEIVGFPVRSGDAIGASVIYTGNSTFKLSLVNYTKKIYYSVPIMSTQLAGALRSSAQWIVEAISGKEVLPLSHFRTIGFTDCQVTISGKTDVLGSSHWIRDALIMASKGGVTKAQPSALSSDGRNFSVTWMHE